MLRQITLGLARAGLIVPLWSDRLLEEWARTAPATAARRMRHWRAARSRRWRRRSPQRRWCRQIRAARRSSGLPDSGDVHVLATAITGGADAILTLNLRDFPRARTVGA